MLNIINLHFFPHLFIPTDGSVCVLSSVSRLIQDKNAEYQKEFDHFLAIRQVQGQLLLHTILFIS